MKILTAIESAALRGSERAALFGAAALAEAGHEVVVLPWRSEPSPIDDPSDDGPGWADRFKTIAGPERGLSFLPPYEGTSSRWFANLRDGSRMRKLIRQLEPDIVLSHLSIRKAFLMLGAANGPFSRNGVPVVQVQHCRPDFNAAMKPYYKAYLRYFDGVAAVSEGARRLLILNFGTDPRRTVRLWSPCRLNEDKNANGDETPSPEIFEMLGDAPVILGVGALEPKKGFVFLTEAFGVLASRRKDVRLVLVGRTGPDRERVERMAADMGVSDRVHFMGPQKSVWPWYKRASVFALPSEVEEFGMVLPEAMSCGVTPVAADCEFGPREILENGKYGYLVETRTPQAFAAALAAALEKPMAAGPLKERAKVFSARETVGDWEIFLHSVRKG